LPKWNPLKIIITTGLLIFTLPSQKVVGLYILEKNINKIQLKNKNEFIKYLKKVLKNES